MSDLVIRTVLGDIAPDRLGVTMAHEHLLIDQRVVTFRPSLDEHGRKLADRPVTLEILGWLQWNWAANRDNLVLDDESLAADEASMFREAGGNSLVDCTVSGLGRRPAAIRRIAAAAGINVVMATGYYVSSTHPAHVARMTVVELADEMVREVRQGDASDGVRAGIIGEIGSSWPMTDAERRVFQAAAIAQRELGCLLTTHPARHAASPVQIIDLLEHAGADLSRVAIGHIERTVPDLDGIRRLADRGCFIEYDLFGTDVTATYPYQEAGVAMPSDAQRLDQIAALAEAGHSNQILVSQDVSTKHRTRRYGGVGYDHVLRDVVPWMRRRGFVESLIEGLLIANPRRALAMPNV